MRLFIGLSPLAFAQWPICQFVAYRTREGVSGSLYSGPTATEEKKFTFNAGAWVQRTEVLRYSCCQEKEAPSLSAPLRSGWPKLIKSRRGGEEGSLRSLFCVAIFPLPPNLKL